jgi:hypothetical protein
MLAKVLQSLGEQVMRIDATPGSSTSLGLNPANANRSAGTDNVASDPSAASDPTPGDGQFQPTSQLLQLSAALERIPSVRQEQVGEVAQRLSAGELATPQARQQTVESILGSSPGHG